MSDTSLETIVSADGRFRVRIESDTYAENPRDWSEPLTGALTVTSARYYTTPVPGPLADQWSELMFRCEDSVAERIIARYVRVFHGGVTATLSPYDGPTIIFYLTRAMADAAGIPTDTTTMQAAVDAELQEYRSWIEGDVFVLVCEELANWQRTDDGHTDETMQSWEVLESLGGVLGYQYATEEAARMLADAAGVIVRPASFAAGNLVATGIICPGCLRHIVVSDHGKTECGGEGEGDCDIARGEAGSAAQQSKAQEAHQRAAEIAEPFQD